VGTFLGALLKLIEVEFQGRKIRVPAMKSQGRLWFHFNGESHVIDVDNGARRGGGDKTGTKPGQIAAPMPGKITKVWVSRGDSVNRGQALVVMEAMKMEYTLEADHDGKVIDVSVAVGQQVALGQLLVKVGEA
jgi:biotin carboxyl carrier protein